MWFNKIVIASLNKNLNPVIGSNPYDVIESNHNVVKYNPDRFGESKLSKGRQSFKSK